MGLIEAEDLAGFTKAAIATDAPDGLFRYGFVGVWVVMRDYLH